MNKTNNLVIGLILSLVFTACSSGRIDSLERRPDECIVIAKLNIKNFDEDVTTSSKLLFKYADGSTNSVSPDDSNYIYMKLPLGKHFLSGIALKNKIIYLTERMLNFETPESKIYYLGDINSILSIDFKYEAMNDLFGPPENKIKTITPPVIWIENKIKDAKFYFNSLFPYKVTITQCKFVGDTTNVFSDTSKVKGPQYFFKD